LIFCAVHEAAKNQWPASQVGQLPDYVQYRFATEQLFKKGMMIIEYWQTIGNTEVWCRGHTLNQSPADSTHGAPYCGVINILHNPILSLLEVQSSTVT
jgi:hypothetical protein